MISVLAVVVSLLALVMVSILLQGKRKYSWIQFYTRGKEAGFSSSEISSLKSIAQSAGFEDPTAIFWSVRYLDQIIKTVTQINQSPERVRDPAAVKFMGKLYEYRKKVELESPKYTTGLKSSRALEANQGLKILVQGLGVLNAVLLENGQRYLVVSYPTGKRIPKGFDWNGQKISIYLWRLEDAGYTFDSYVIDTVEIRSVPVLHIAHSDSLFRAQKRKSIRAKSKIPAYLYLLKRIEGAYEKPERVPGMKCFVEDISEDGTAVFIGGKAKPGLQVKVQFDLGAQQVVMSGVTKSVEYNPDKNQSLLHIQAMAPSQRMRNVILAYVYNVFADEEASPIDEIDERMDEVL